MLSLNRVGGSGASSPRNILNSTLPEMQSSANFLGTQINIKSSRLGYCKHTSYTNGGGGGLECLGEKLGCLGGEGSPPLDRTLNMHVKTI